MATAIVTGAGPVTPLATPTGFVFTPLGFPFWTNAPAGTWWFVCFVIEDQDPEVAARASAVSNEQGPFLLNNAPLGGGSLSWTVDPSWPASCKIVIMGTQIQGDYYDANVHVMSLDSTQAPSNGLGGVVAASDGTTFFAAQPGNGFRAQNLLVSPGNVPYEGPGGQLYSVSGGSVGDELLTSDIVDAVELAGDTVIRNPAIQYKRAYDWQRNTYLFQRGVHFTDGAWDLGAEGIICLGTFLLGDGVSTPVIRAGSLTPDGSRVGGPTICYMSQPKSVVDPGGAGVTDMLWQHSQFDLYAGALCSLHSLLGDDVGGVDPDPANKWLLAPAGAHGMATSGDPPSIVSINLNLDGTWPIQSFGFRGMAGLRIRNSDVTKVPILDMDAVGLTDVGALEIGIGATVQLVKMENASRGLVVATFTGTARPIFDRCRVVSRSLSDIVWASTTTGPASQLRVLDCAFDEAADNNNPVVEFSAAWIAGFDRQLRIAHRVDVQVVDFAGTPVAGATVTMLDKAGVQAFQAVTGADGKIAQQVVDRDIYEAVTNGPHAPALLSAHVAAGRIVNTRGGTFTLQIERPGFEVETVKTTLDEALVLVYTTHSSRADPIAHSIETRDEVETAITPVSVVATVESPEEIAVTIGGDTLSSEVDL